MPREASTAEDDGLILGVGTRGSSCCLNSGSGIEVLSFSSPFSNRSVPIYYCLLCIQLCMLTGDRPKVIYPIWPFSLLCDSMLQAMQPTY